MAAAPQPANPFCASCRRPLAGRFCSNCGEEQLDFHNLTVRHFLAHSLHEIFELDGKIWRTLRTLLFHPGLLAAEYSAGRRRLYANPFRLLITAAILYELLTSGGVQVAMNVGPIVVSLAPTAVKESTGIAETVKGVDRFHLLGGLLAKQQHEKLESESAREKFHQHLAKFAEPLSFANVLLLAMALHALFGRRRHHFVEHGVFAMHFMSFVLLTASLFAPVAVLLRAGWGSVVLPVVFAIVAWQFLYLVIAIRRFYFGLHIVGFAPKLYAGFGAVAVYFLNSVFITAVQTLGAAIALWMAGSRA
ncbi:MAG TPA: DUF3667 domain-containing protein [Bryobacteraceae bacterium]|nr:DUF3667 domain-containing protein [Bryobacteraceae bacterium]